jgi:ppGpp synthetase/RelA/SpoT-type nucleotidyltranferase
MEELEIFYSHNIKNYETATKKIEELIKEILKSKNIQIHSVSSRVKSLDSYLKKAKKYKDPKNEITDYIGVRIISYVLKDMETISSTIENEFNIDRKNSKNKGKELGNDKMGYRSIHCIASINDDRKKLSEYKDCKDCVFEIQIRTILQHTWAEIEHDKNYKYSGVLPNEIERRLNLLSAVLESADNEFNTISQEIDNYIKSVKKEIEEDNRACIELNSTSIKEFIINRYKKYNIHYDSDSAENDIEIIREIKEFGITNIKEFEDIINKDCLEYMATQNLHKNYIGFIRIMLILKDAKKYFENCFNNSWGVLSSESRKIYEKLAPDVLSIIKSKGIEIADRY